MDVEAAFVPVIPATEDAPAAKEGVPVKYPLGMVRVIVPPETVLVGVNTRTGDTTEPTPLFVKVNEVKVGEMRMGFATAFEAICFFPASWAVESIKTPVVARAAPRVKPDSVTVNAAP